MALKPAGIGSGMHAVEQAAARPVSLGRPVTNGEAALFQQHVRAEGLENEHNIGQIQHYVSDSPETVNRFGGALNHHVLPTSNQQAQVAISAGDPRRALTMSRDGTGAPRVVTLGRDQFDAPSAAQVFQQQPQRPIDNAERASDEDSDDDSDAASVSSTDSYDVHQLEDSFDDRSQLEAAPHLHAVEARSDVPLDRIQHSGMFELHTARFQPGERAGLGTPGIADCVAITAHGHDERGTVPVPVAGVLHWTPNEKWPTPDAAFDKVRARMRAEGVENPRFTAVGMILEPKAPLHEVHEIVGQPDRGHDLVGTRLLINRHGADGMSTAHDVVQAADGAVYLSQSHLVPHPDGSET